MLYIAGSKRKLQFITVRAPNSQAPTDTEDRRTVREFVMRDYLRQKNSPEWKLAQPPVPRPIDSHLSRFRSSISQGRAKGPKRTKKTRLAPRDLPEPKQRQLVPAPVPTEDQVKQQQQQRKSEASIHDLDMLDAFRIFSIDLSDSETLGLLQYYYTSFWANSYACNPEGSWISVALMDPATMHATLTLVAIHRRDRFSIDLSNVYYRHRGEAMKILASRLNDPKEAMGDTTIGAVAILSTSDNEFDWSREAQMSHSNALSGLIALRGGIEALSTNRHVQRIAAWADLLQSAMHGTELQVEIPSTIRLPSLDELEASTSQPGIPNTAPGILLQGLPQKITRIIQQLRILAGLKAALLVNRTQKLCKMFSDLLWKVEHEVLELRENSNVADENGRYNGLLGKEVMTTAVGIGALIFSYSTLRDLASPILFRRLSRNLKDCFLAAQRLSQSSGLDGLALGSSLWGDRDEKEAAILLWLLYLGWKDLSSGDGWFVGQAAQFCVSKSLLSRDLVVEKIRSVIPQARELDSATDDFWHDVEGILGPEIIRRVGPESSHSLSVL